MTWKNVDRRLFLSKRINNRIFSTHVWYLPKDRDGVTKNIIETRLGSNIRKRPCVYFHDLFRRVLALATIMWPLSDCCTHVPLGGHIVSSVNARSSNPCKIDKRPAFGSLAFRGMPNEQLLFGAFVFRRRDLSRHYFWLLRLGRERDTRREYCKIEWVWTLCD